MKITGRWLSEPGTQALCSALTGHGYQALFVGGCVRNALIGVPVNDIDIATDALPGTVTDIAKKSGFKVVPTGIDHGTVTVIAKGIVHEVTTFRRDVETDGRHAKVIFSAFVAEDAARRDFTMNALYAQADGTVVDPLGGGITDLMARHVRFVGDASQRITEDYLRILRFFRFHAWYGDPLGGIDAEGLAACAAHSAGIETLSRERVTEELRKLLSAPDPAPAVASMAQSGVLATTLSGADARALPILVSLGSADWLARLAVIGGDTDNLRLSRADRSRLQVIREEMGTLRPAAELGYRHGIETAEAIILCRAATFEAPPPENWRAGVLKGASATMPVTAADLMPDFQGPALGAKLRALEDRWIASGFTLCRDALLG